MSINRGDMPVSPTQGLDAQGLPLQEMDYGMTIREKIAMAAMQGLLASSGNENRTSLTNGEVIANSVMFADALLAELERTK